MKSARFSALLLVALVGAAGCFAARPAMAQEHHGEETAAGEHAGDPNPLSVDPDLAIWTGIVFILLFFVLSRFAWPQISAALLDREKRIEDNIAAAEAMQRQAKQLLAQHEAKLAGAADQVRALLEEARRDAEHTKVQIVAEAKQASDVERDRAVRDVQRAADRAMNDIAEKIANQSVELAGMIVRQNITPDQQSKLVRDALSQLAAAEPSKN
jgi:F-type H+-transporting ATPase subunit b